MLSKKITNGIKVFIFGVDPVANVKTPKMLRKILHKVFSFMKIFKFLQGLVGFGNLRFAEIKSRPSAYQTSELSEAEILMFGWPWCCLKDVREKYPLRTFSLSQPEAQNLGFSRICQSDMSGTAPDGFC